MSEFSKRIFKMLARVVVAAACRLFGKADAAKHPGTRFAETRKTRTNIKITKKSKGEVL